MSLHDDLERILSWERGETPDFPSRELEETLAAKLHDLYQIEARRQGDVRHHDDYAALAEHTKECDRVLARFILQHACTQDCIAMIRDPLERPLHDERGTRCPTS